MRRGRLFSAALLAALLFTGCESGLDPEPTRLVPLAPLIVAEPTDAGAPVTLAFDILLAHCGESATLRVQTDRRVGEITISATTTAPVRHDGFCIDIAGWTVRDSVRVVPWWSPDSLVIRYRQPGGDDSLRVLHRPAAP